MRITTVRGITQVFFFVLFIWFCIASTFGQSFWQLRGWPVNWFLQLDPLVALGTILTTRTLYTGLLWAIATVVLTVFWEDFSAAGSAHSAPCIISSVISACADAP